MSEAIIKLENIWKIYQLGKVELLALKSVNLEIPPGGFVTSWVLPVPASQRF